MSLYKYVAANPLEMADAFSCATWQVALANVLSISRDRPHLPQRTAMSGIRSVNVVVVRCTWRVSVIKARAQTFYTGPFGRSHRYTCYWSICFAPVIAGISTLMQQLTDGFLVWVRHLTESSSGQPVVSTWIVRVHPNDRCSVTAARTARSVTSSP